MRITQHREREQATSSDARQHVNLDGPSAHEGDHRGSTLLPLAVADARRLPFADAAFDVAHCSLALHHMAPEEAVAMLREMARVSRRGVIVNDLVRGWLGYVGAWALSRAFTRNPMTRHDAPLSARRAYTRAEMAALAGRAGLEVLAFAGFLGYRVAMVARRAP